MTQAYLEREKENGNLLNHKRFCALKLEGSIQLGSDGVVLGSLLLGN